MLTFITVILLVGYGCIFLLATIGIFVAGELWPGAKYKYPITRQMITILLWPIILPYLLFSIIKEKVSSFIDNIKKEINNGEWWEKKK